MPNAIPFASLTSFENQLQQRLEKEKPEERQYPSSFSEVYVLNNTVGRYEFSPSSHPRYGLPLKLFISGPIVDRNGNSTGKVGTLGYLDLVKSKAYTSGYAGGSGATQRATKDAIDGFIYARARVGLEGLPWDINMSHPEDGWCRILKRMPSGQKKEIAIVAAESPGRGLVSFSPDGKRVLTFEEDRRNNIPPGVLAHIVAEFQHVNVWATLVKDWQAVMRHHDLTFPTAPAHRLNAWKIGPGAKYFPNALGNPEFKP